MGNGDGIDMAKAKEMANSGKRMGKKVLATDTAQDVVEVVVDGLEEVAVDKADDVAENVKARAARAGGRSPKSPAAKKSSSRKSTAERPTAKTSSARKSGARKSGMKKRAPKKPSAKWTGAKKKTARKSPAKRAGAKSPWPSGKVPEVDSPKEVEREAALIRARSRHPKERSRSAGAARRVIPEYAAGRRALADACGSGWDRHPRHHRDRAGRVADHLLRAALLTWDSFAGRSWVRNEGRVPS